MDLAPLPLFLNTDGAQDIHLILSAVDVGMEMNMLTPEYLYFSNLATIIVSSRAPCIWFASPVKAILLVFLLMAMLLRIWTLLGAQCKRELKETRLMRV